MKIEVSKEDIRLGIAQDCERCVIARAILRAKPLGVTSVRVTGTTACLKGPTLIRDVVLPTEVHNFIVRFDGGVSVEPFFFEIRF